MPEPARRGVILVRALGPSGATALQGLRTAVSLALGDRAADLVLARDAAAVLDAGPGSEAADNLAALRDAGIAVFVDAGSLPAGQAPPAWVRPLGQGEVVDGLADAPFVQVF